MILAALINGTPINPPLTHEEVQTKACHEFGQGIENSLIEKGMGETWRHSQPQTQSADREIQRHA